MVAGLQGAFLLDFRLSDQRGRIFAIYQRNPLYFYPSVIPYMLVNWFSDRIDGES